MCGKGRGYDSPSYEFYFIIITDNAIMYSSTICLSNEGRPWTALVRVGLWTMTRKFDNVMVRQGLRTALYQGFRMGSP
jgi:hypothetical protein